MSDGLKDQPAELGADPATIDPAVAPPTTAAPTAKRRHVYEVDIVRILTFACVIAVHTTSHTVAASDLPLYGFLGLVHFTREVFFALSAFVLVYSYLARPVPMRRFWPRRFLLVGVPYVVWSAIYVVAGYLHTPKGGLGTLALTFVTDTLTGSAWYHLYFLLVTMQVYLLIPAILWLVRATRGRHVLLLCAAGVVQLGLSALVMYWPDAWPWYAQWSKQLVVTYAFFILAGAVAADHAVPFLDWVAGHRRLILGLTVLAGLVTLGVFALQWGAFGMTPYHAGTPLQPIEMFWSLAIGVGFLALGSRWAERRKPGGWLDRGVAAASDRSFGIFLSHPLMLWILLWIGGDIVERTVPTPWLTLVCYLVVVVCAVGLTEIARRVPYASLALTGRPRIRADRG